MVKKIVLLGMLLFSILYIAFRESDFEKKNTSEKMYSNSDLNVEQNVNKTYINEEGNTIASRVVVPNSYMRVTYPENTFSYYIQNYPLLPYGAKIVNHDKSLWYNQKDHVGVLNLDVPENGLQQCADALIRLRSEYLWNTNQKDKIGFNFTSGDYFSWNKYAEGFRPKVKGNKVQFLKLENANDSKANFYNYLNVIFNYAGTLSMFHEMEEIQSINKLKVGDMIVVGGTPGHIAMIGDIIRDELGDSLFVLFQGYTPAQSVHIVKNIEHPSISPWQELKLNSEISIPGYTFVNSKYIRFK